MITGTGSAEIGLSYSLAACDGIVNVAAVGLGLSSQGIVGVMGNASAGVGLSIEKGTSITGNGSAGLYLSAGGAGQIFIVGRGAAEIGISVSPITFITINGAGSAGIGLSALLSGFIREVTADDGFQAWVVNAKTRGAAFYSNFPLNSIFKLQGQYYGCTSQGIVRLSGNTDQGSPIQARLRSGISDGGANVKKRFPEARVICRNEGFMELSVIVGERKEIVYEVAAREGRQGVHTKRKTLAKGVEGQVVQIEWRNVQGSDFDIQQTELDVEYLRRR
jgi:hypothetical protein